jgi:hypothetical protein
MHGIHLVGVGCAGVEERHHLARNAKFLPLACVFEKFLNPFILYFGR